MIGGSTINCTFMNPLIIRSSDSNQLIAKGDKQIRYFTGSLVYFVVLALIIRNKIVYNEFGLITSTNFIVGGNVRLMTRDPHGGCTLFSSRTPRARQKKSTFSKLHHKNESIFFPILLHEQIYTISITY